MSIVPFTGVTVGGAITMAWNGTDLAQHSDGRKGRNTASKALTAASQADTPVYCTQGCRLKRVPFSFFVSP